MIIPVSVGLLIVILIINFFYNRKIKDLEAINKKLTALTLDNIKINQELHRALNLLEEANQKLKALDKTKDDFVSVTSHELRTPMAAIRSYAWMALHRSDIPLSKTLEKYLVRVLISTERLINLVNDMLNISRIESGRIEISPEPIDVLSLIRDIVDEVYYSKSEEKNIQFIVSEAKVPKAFADPEKLRQVFLNLVGNSLKFTPNGGKISFDFFSDGKTVEISVSDTGIGISREDLSKLFHKFGRLDTSYTAAATSGGTGLGLYISKNLVELMHGRIWAKSEGANKGTTFIVSLPVATPAVLKDINKYQVKPKGEAKGLEPTAIL
ncbi:MAG: HAMP domain-containing sensor histidine kinase [Candidatus Daviesbacteria bacterium]|nr:HAMP domain-containing sensor histidine kinase [Candidatus Daviesbacteria bacterium]